MAYKRTISAEEIRARSKLDRIFFGHFFFPSDFRSKNAPSHYEVNRMLNDDTYALNAVECHRYWAKTTFLGFLDPVHRIAHHDKALHDFVVLIQETQGQSMNSIARIMDAVEGNSRFRAVYGDFRRGARKWGSKEIVTNNNVRVLAMGTGQRVRSLIEVGGIRPMRTIIDDFESETNASTPEAREQNLNWLYAAVLPFRHRDGQIYLTQSPVASDCSIFRIREDPNWNHLVVPLYEIDEETGDIILNWPEEWPWERIQSERNKYVAQGKSGLFDQEYLLIPYKGEGVGISRDDIRWFDGELVTDEMGVKYIRDFVEIKEDGTKLTEPRNVLVNSFSACDPALGVEKRHDKTALLTACVDFDFNFIVTHAEDFKIGSAYHIGRTFAEFAWMCKANGVGVETVAFQAAVGEAANMWCDEHQVSFDFVRGFNPRTKKDLRLNWAANKFKARKVFLRPGHTKLVKELLEWPKGKHDDYWDALYMAIKIGYTPAYREPGKARTEGKNFLKHFKSIPSHRVA